MLYLIHTHSGDDMLLSEALRIGMKSVTQVKTPELYYDSVTQKGCVLGAIYVGIVGADVANAEREDMAHTSIYKVFKKREEKMAKAKLITIGHLNDYHGWSFQEILDLLESEPQLNIKMG